MWVCDIGPTCARTWSFARLCDDSRGSTEGAHGGLQLVDAIVLLVDLLLHSIELAGISAGSVGIIEPLIISGGGERALNGRLCASPTGSSSLVFLRRCREAGAAATARSRAFLLATATLDTGYASYAGQRAMQ